jgi:hypothetical protein
VAAVTAEQVRTAQAEGYAAGHSLAPPMPNPYAPAHVPAWQQPRTAAGRAAAERQAAPTRILAHVWRVGYQAGQAAYARERGLSLVES